MFKLKEKKFLLFITVVLSIFFLLQPVTTYAVHQPSHPSSLRLSNPLGEAEELTDPRIIVGNIIRALFAVVGSIALLVFIWGGMQWVTSAGSEDKIKKGKTMIIWASFGLGVIFVSYALVTLVIQAITGT